MFAANIVSHALFTGSEYTVTLMSESACMYHSLWPVHMAANPCPCLQLSLPSDSVLYCIDFTHIAVSVLCDMCSAKWDPQ